MLAFLRQVGRFLNTMDAKAMTSFLVSVILLVFVLLMFFFGQQWLQLNEGQVPTSLFAKASSSPLAIVGVISVFVLLALTGFPQILLITATVLTFGPRDGAIYAWVATMASATFTFFLGHMLGGGWVRRFGGERVQSLIGFLGRHGILASALVRIVPSAPFIVVNAAAGAAHIPMWKFWTGTAIGIIPKIAVVATIGAFAPDQSVLKEGVTGLLDFFTSRDPRSVGILAVVITGWLAFLLLIRWFYVRMRRNEES